MAFPLGTVLAAAPGIITAAADIIKVIRDRKKKTPDVGDEKLAELEGLIEQQAIVIEELAINNRNMALAVRNNRIISAIAVGIAITACIIAVTY
jgi:predicted outer membrane lipoprotein